MPHSSWISFHYNIAELTGNPELRMGYFNDVTPEKDPSQLSVWNGPFFPAYGFFKITLPF